jgi:hypothetical protein
VAMVGGIVAGCNSGGTGGSTSTTAAAGGTVTTTAAGTATTSATGGAVTTSTGDGTATTAATAQVSLFPESDANNKWGFTDGSGNWVIQPQWDFTDFFSGGIARVATGNAKSPTWGYIDATGKAVTPVQYSDAGNFNEGLAAVRTKSDGKWGYIDTTGKVVIAEKFAQAAAFSEGVALVTEDTAGKYGYIDKTGKYVIEPAFAAAGPFKQGLAAASTEKNGKWGYIDPSGKFVIEAKFDAIADFSEGYAVAGQLVPGKDATKPGGITYGLIDKTGAWVAQPTYARIGNVSDAMARVQIINTDGSISGGFIDTTGKLVLSSTKWMPAGDFSEGLAVVAVGKKYGFIDKTGAYVLQPIYDLAEPFKGGLARVIAAGSNPAEIGYIDKTGAIVIWSNPAKSPKWATETTTTTAAK